MDRIELFAEKLWLHSLPTPKAIQQQNSGNPRYAELYPNYICMNCKLNKIANEFHIIVECPGFDKSVEKCRHAMINSLRKKYNEIITGLVNIYTIPVARHFFPKNESDWRNTQSGAA